MTSSKFLEVIQHPSPYTNGYTHSDEIPVECGKVCAFQTTGACCEDIRNVHTLCHWVCFYGQPSPLLEICVLRWPALLVFLCPVSSIHKNLLCGTLWPTDPSWFNGVCCLELFLGQFGFFPHFSQVGTKGKEAAS